MAELALHNISKSYKPGLLKKRLQALHHLTLEVKTGEVFGLVGPNGAGKSTTIRLLLGLIRPDTGRILFRDKPLQNSGFRSQIGYLPENPYLYDHLSLEELLVFAAETSGMSTPERGERVELLLGQTDMSYARKRRLRTFSKGMLQRAGICFALLHDPDVVILDEPMSGLDPLGRKQVIEIILDLKAAGKTIFFCSHILSDVERLCDRIGILVSGRLVKMLNRGEFQSDERFSAHLLVDTIGDSQKDALTSAGWSLKPAAGDDFVLSVPAEELAKATQVLAELDIRVKKSLEGHMSLEELFVATVKESSP